MSKTIAETLTGKKGNALRVNVLLPEAEFRYLYALLTEHDPVSTDGQDLVNRLTKVMGTKLDKLNSASK